MKMDTDLINDCCLSYLAISPHHDSRIFIVRTYHKPLPPPLCHSHSVVLKTTHTTTSASERLAEVLVVYK